MAMENFVRPWQPSRNLFSLPNFPFKGNPQQIPVRTQYSHLLVLTENCKLKGGIHYRDLAYFQNDYLGKYDSIFETL
jgi:hypothetical protein